MKNLLVELTALVPCFLLGMSCSMEWGGQTHSVPEWVKILLFRFLIPLCVLLAWAVFIRDESDGMSSDVRVAAGILTLALALVVIFAGYVVHRFWVWFRKKIEEGRDSYGNDSTGY